MCDVVALTNVPVERQKLLCPGVWKGALVGGAALDAGLALKPGQKELTIMLMGSADAAPVPTEADKVVFEEDLMAEDVEKAQAVAAAEAAAKAEGLIAALQLEPGPERDASVAMMSNLPIKYNFYASGLAQDQIEDALRRRRERGSLLDECVMTLGHDVGKAYVNAAACLADGTLASGLDNGRIQLWRHARKVRIGQGATLQSPRQHRSQQLAPQP